MHRYSVGLTVWMLLSIAAWGAESSLPPSQQMLRVDPAGEWQLLVQVTVCKLETRTGSVTKKVPENKTVTQIVNGESVVNTVTRYKDVVETHQYTVAVPDYQTVAKQLPAASLQAFETDGRIIPPDKLRARVGEGVPVVVSASDAKLAEAYAGLFKPGTIVIAVSQIHAGRPTPPVGANSPSSPVVAPSSPTEAAPTPQLPRSPAPEFMVLGRSGVDDIVLRRMSESTGPATGLAIFKKGAATEQAPVTMLRTARLDEAFTLAAKQLHFQLADDVEVPFARIKERLARESVVVYSPAGVPIDPFWLRNLKSTTLVVSGPQLPTSTASCGPVAPAMMPAPVGIPAPGPSRAVPAPAPPAPEPSPEASAQPAQQSAIERELIDRGNAERVNAELPPLIGERLVSLAARRHAADMAKRDTLSHEFEGRGVGDRLDQSGFAWVACGENLACGQTTPAAAIEAWLNSPGHRANLLGRDYTHIGVASADGPAGRNYWTLVVAQAR